MGIFERYRIGECGAHRRWRSGKDRVTAVALVALIGALESNVTRQFLRPRV